MVSYQDADNVCNVKKGLRIDFTQCRLINFLTFSYMKECMSPDFGQL